MLTSLSRLGFAYPLCPGLQVRPICLRLPLRRLLGQRGGKVGSTLGLVFVSDILEVCGGVISGAGHLVTRFCTKPSGSCHTKGHRTKKVLLRKNNTFYIKHTRAGQARFELSLARLLISDNQDVESLLGKDMAFVEWAAYFGGLQAKAEHSPNARSSGSLESWEKIETPTLEAFKANQSLKTPKRLCLGGLQSVDVETLPMTEERLEPFSMVEGFAEDDDGAFLEAKIKSGLRTVFAEWNRLEATFNMIHLKLMGLPKASNTIVKLCRKP
jgi:hypothetical protein